MEVVQNNHVFLLFLFLNTDASWPNWLPVIFHLPSRLQSPGPGKEQGPRQSCPSTLPNSLLSHLPHTVIQLPNLRRKYKELPWFSGCILVCFLELFGKLFFLLFVNLLCGYKCCLCSRSPISVFFHCEPDELFHWNSHIVSLNFRSLAISFFLIPQREEDWTPKNSALLSLTLPR